MIIVKSERHTTGRSVQALHTVIGVTAGDVNFNGTVSVRWPHDGENDAIQDPHLTLRAYTTPTQGGEPRDDSRYRKTLSSNHELDLREAGARSIIGLVFTCDTCSQQRECRMCDSEGITIDLKGGAMTDHAISTIYTFPGFDSKQADCLRVRKARKNRRGPDEKKIIYRSKRHGT